MRRLAAIAVLLLTATACGGSAGPPTAQSVLDAFTKAGLAVNNPKPGTRAPNTPLPNSYKENMVFEVPGAEPGSGGQIFTCDTKQNCDAIYAYFDALKALAGPYLYRNPDGRVIAQMNSALPADVAAKYQAALQTVK
jgi:hypothetical protein